MNDFTLIKITEQGAFVRMNFNFFFNILVAVVVARNEYYTKNRWNV